MAFAGVSVLLENKNLVYLGTSTEKGYDPLPFATGTCEPDKSKRLAQERHKGKQNRQIHQHLERPKIEPNKPQAKEPEPH